MKRNSFHCDATVYGMRLHPKIEKLSHDDVARWIAGGTLLFKLVRNGFKYQGVNVTRDMQSLHQEDVCLPNTTILVGVE